MIAGLSLGGIGVFLSLAGIAVMRGRTELLSQYPTRDGPKTVAYGCGGLIAVTGLLTIGLGYLIERSPEYGDSTALWVGFTGFVVVISFVIAGIAASAQT